MEAKPTTSVKKFIGSIADYLSKTWRDYAYLFSVSAVLIFLDQISKSWVRKNLSVGAEWLPDALSWLLPYARFRHWHNTGAAFGLFQGGSLVFTVLAFVVAAFIIYYFPRIERKDWWLRLALSMQLAGALGNLIDRLQFDGRVTDFISVGSFAIFNIADSCITVGTVILVAGVYLSEWKDRRKKKQVQDESSLLDD